MNFNKIIITTPNRSFNKFYMLGQDFRHDDHKWEYTELQFKEYIQEIVTDDLKVTFLDIGDTVDGISCSQGVILQK